MTYDQINPSHLPPVYMATMLNFDQVAISIEELDGWGVKGCGKNTPAPQTTSCSYFPNSKNPYGLDWSGKKFSTYDATTYFPLYKGHHVNIQKEKSAKVLGLDVVVNKFLYNEAGILGLAPNSTFWDYIARQGVVDGKDVYSTLWLTTKDTFTWEDLFGNEKAHVFNGSELRLSDDINKVVDQERSDEVFIESTEGFWGASNIEVISSANESKTLYKGEACFTSNAHATILTQYPQHFRNQTYFDVCREAECGPDTYILNGPTLIVHFKDDNDKIIKTVEIQPNQYIYQQENKIVNVSVENIGEYQDNAGCSDKAQFGFGRMFMFFNQLVLKSDLSGAQDNKFAIFDYSYRPSLAKEADVGSLVASGLIFTIAIFICISTLRAKGIREAEGNKDIFARGSSQVSPKKPGLKFADADSAGGDTIGIVTVGAETRLKQSKKTEHGDLID